MTQVKTALLIALFAAVSSLSPDADASQTKPISIDLAQARLADVLQGLSAVAGGSLEIEPGLEAKVNIRLDDVSWMTALDAVCESAGCAWRLLGPAPRILEVTKSDRSRVGSGLDSTIDIDLVGAPANDALIAFAALAGSELTMDRRVSGKVSIRLERVTARTALTALCESLGCTWSPPKGVSGALVVNAPKQSAPPSPLVRGLSERISLELDGAAIDTTMKSFARLLGCELVLDPSLQSSVTVELDRVPVVRALNRICADANCTWSLVPSGSNLTLAVVSK